MFTNKFEMQGRVSYIDIQFKDKNDKLTVYTTINLGVKKSDNVGNEEKNWDNFFITFFNTVKTQTAEKLREQIKEGDYIRVVGKLKENRYVPNGTDKEKSEIQLIGYGFKKQRYDEWEQKWVDCP